MKIINVILSGGVGSRLWPLSRKNRPKQYLNIFGNKSLFQLTVERNLDLCDSILVLGNIDNYELSEIDLLKIHAKNYQHIVETTSRNTAAAIAFAAFSVKIDDILLVTPSDHLVDDQKEYKEAVEEAVKIAEQNSIVTFGLVPSRPETGFGYIETKENDVIGFNEKPDLETAEKFLKDGNFLWNSGMFCFKAGVFLEELKKYQPEVYFASKEAIEKRDNNLLPLAESLKIPSISVDYAVMERTEVLKVVKAKFKWSDMGSFESLYDYFKSCGHYTDQDGNMVIGKSIHTEFLGIKDSILVITDDAILVLEKKSAQKVKEIYENLSNKNLT